MPPFLPQKKNMLSRQKRMPRWDTFKIPSVNTNSSLGGYAPEETSGVPVTPSQTPSNTPTPSVTAQPTPTPSMSPTNTNTPTASVTAQPTSTPTNTPTPSATPSIQRPSDIPNLQLWFDAQSGATVSSWTNYGLLGGSLSQGNASFQPSIRTRTIPNWGYSGTSVLFQNRDNMSIGYSSTAFSAHTTYIVFIQDDNTGSSANGFYSFSGGATNWNFQFLNTNFQTASEPTNFSRPQTLNDGILFVGSGNSVFYSATTNDSNFTSSTSTTSNRASTAFQIGTNPGFNQTNALDVFEVLRFNRVLTSTEHAFMVNYLKTKYSY